jgi:hypothetical protein
VALTETAASSFSYYPKAISGPEAEELYPPQFPEHFACCPSKINNGRICKLIIKDNLVI